MAEPTLFILLIALFFITLIISIVQYYNSEKKIKALEIENAVLKAKLNSI